MAYQFMRSNKKRYTIKEMAALFGVKRSAYYKWTKHGVSERRAKADAELLVFITKIVEKNKYRYGSPRVCRELWIKYGKSVSQKRVARLMRENGLNAKRKGKFIPTTDSKHNLDVCENILDRQFHAERAGQKWVSDITYLRFLGGWLYLTVIIDLFDRKVIGWAFSQCLDTASTTIPALQMAVRNRAPVDGFLFHSDRGVQYCAKVFRETLQMLCPAVRQSMSRKGNCWDNACAESFFKTLKNELETLDGKHSLQDIRQSVFMYIEAYYNRVRMHSALDYFAPNEYSSGVAA